MIKGEWLAIPLNPSQRPRARVDREHSHTNPPQKGIVMKMELECQECDKVFSRSTKSVYPTCPRCKSTDLYPTSFFGRKKKNA